jgi:hypothetical protein
MGKKSEEKPGKKAKKEKKEKKEKKLKKAGKKTRTADKKQSARSVKVSPGQRIEMIATAAYYIAERHGFTPGMSEVDWQAAERQIDAMLDRD